MENTEINMEKAGLFISVENAKKISVMLYYLSKNFCKNNCVILIIYIFILYDVDRRVVNKLR